MDKESWPASLDHIHCDPAILGGKPCIRGTRISVESIYFWHELQSLSADAIIEDFPHLKHADVYAALAYFWDNRNAILAKIDRDAAFVEELRRQTPSRLPKASRSDALSPG